MDERRHVPRTRSLLSGTIVLNERQSAMDCCVRNISAEGAMVVCPEMFRMPDSFALIVPTRAQTHQATVVWRRNDRAGIAIAPSSEAPVKRKPWLQGGRRKVNRGISLGY